MLTPSLREAMQCSSQLHHGYSAVYRAQARLWRNMGSNVTQHKPEGALSAEIEYYLQGPEEEAEDGDHLACTPGKQLAAAASRSLTSLHSIPMSSHTTTPCGPTTRQVGASLCAHAKAPDACFTVALGYSWHASARL